MQYEVIDNFLDEGYFNTLESLLEEIPWFFQKDIAYDNIEEDKIFLLYHMFYAQNTPTGALYEKLIPLLEKLGAEILVRIKANLYPNTEKLHEHPIHRDFEFSTTSALLSLNTCDGYTKLADGTKIASVANRVIFFDSGEDHCSTTTTNAPARFNININYIQPEKRLDID
jgi:hypothetical protein|tara:strand:- start:3723 stop:4232 length:510 start_codon:yes stop_codon:yes gene_type:complete